MFRIRDSIFSRFDKKQRDRGIKYLQNVENLQYRDISISLGFFLLFVRYVFYTCSRLSGKDRSFQSVSIQMITSYHLLVITFNVFD